MMYSMQTEKKLQIKMIFHLTHISYTVYDIYYDEEISAWNNRRKKEEKRIQLATEVHTYATTQL